MSHNTGEEVSISIVANTVDEIMAFLLVLENRTIYAAKIFYSVRNLQPKHGREINSMVEISFCT